VSPAELRDLCDNVLNLVTTTVDGMQEVRLPSSHRPLPFSFAGVVAVSVRVARQARSVWRNGHCVQVPRVRVCAHVRACGDASVRRYIAHTKREGNAPDFIIDFDRAVRMRVITSRTCISYCRVWRAYRSIYRNRRRC
jgi:hypothetical protein